MNHNIKQYFNKLLIRAEKGQNYGVEEISEKKAKTEQGVRKGRNGKSYR